MKFPKTIRERFPAAEAKKPPDQINRPARGTADAEEGNMAPIVGEQAALAALSG
jgi:hypothetical protein